MFETIDPEDVNKGKAHKLTRRVCVFQGPNFTDQLTVSAGRSCGLIYALLTTVITLLVTSIKLYIKPKMCPENN